MASFNFSCAYLVILFISFEWLWCVHLWEWEHTRACEDQRTTSTGVAPWLLPCLRQCGCHITFRDFPVSSPHLAIGALRLQTHKLPNLASNEFWESEFRTSCIQFYCFTSELFPQLFFETRSYFTCSPGWPWTVTQHISASLSRQFFCLGLLSAESINVSRRTSLIIFLLDILAFNSSTWWA